MNKNNNN